MSFGKTGFVLTMAGLLVGCTSAPSTISSPRAPAQTPLEATYQVDGQEFVLNAGKVIVEHMPGAASKSILQVYGEPVSGDLNDDGIADAALLLVQDSGGSGTFYHVAAALSREGAL